MNKIIKLNEDQVMIHNNEHVYYVVYNGLTYCEGTREALISKLKKSFSVLEYPDVQNE